MDAERFEKRRRKKPGVLTWADILARRILRGKAEEETQIPA